MNKPQEPLNDLELDRLLAAASSPPQIKGFEAKLLSRMASVHQAVVPHDNVVPFVRPVAFAHKPARPVSHRITIAAALAASLIIGVLISDNTAVVDVIDGVSGVATSGQVAEFAPAGLDEIDIDDGENQS
ncbi:MAG: hypothetical protein M3O03_10785 [Pseudomonadota bacterium]|nr:hypothetical protein [Pseudomonadota bacterium]